MSVHFRRAKSVLLRCWAPDLPAWSHGSSDEEEEEKQRRAPAHTQVDFAFALGACVRVRCWARHY